jgi:hypothetical protein
MKDSSAEIERRFSLIYETAFLYRYLLLRWQTAASHLPFAWDYFLIQQDKVNTSSRNQVVVVVKKRKSETAGNKLRARELSLKEMWA